MQRDSYNKLSPLTIFYHWTVGILMIAALSFGTYLESLEKQSHELIYIHKNVGLAILILAVARLSWRYINGFFHPMHSLKQWEKKSSAYAHYFLLFATLVMPISGMVMSLAYGCEYCVVPIFGLYEIGPFQQNITLATIGYFIHAWGGVLVIVAVFIHAAAALKHHYWDKDDTLRRMFGKEII